MIISHKYKFIFIKTRKTAGSSTEAYLSKVCGEDDVVTKVTPVPEGHMPRNTFPPFDEGVHHTGMAIRNNIPSEILDNYYKFCVERNPLDKVVSYYYFLQHRTDDPMPYCFELYMHNIGMPYNYHQYTDDKGDILVDHIVKYENLNEELAVIFKKLGVPFTGTLEEKEKTLQRPISSRNYKKFLDPRLVRAIERKFKKEIDYNNYIF